MIESFTSLPCLKLQILPSLRDPQTQPHTYARKLSVCQKSLNYSSQKEQLRMVQAFSWRPLTQCEVQLFVGGRREGKKKKTNLGRSDTKEKVHCESPAKHAARLSPEIIIPPVLKEVFTMPMISISLANKSIYISTSHLYTKNTLHAIAIFFSFILLFMIFVTFLQNRFKNSGYRDTWVAQQIELLWPPMEKLYNIPSNQCIIHVL